MEKYIKQGKDYIENELKYSFKSMETSTIANRLLNAFTKGFELGQEYMLEKESETKKYLNDYIKASFENEVKI